MVRFIVISIFVVAGIGLYYLFETPVKYVDLDNNTCSCWVDGYSLPSKDQCKLVGKNYELVRVQKCN